ncbi:MAG: hypothetical protein AAB539_02895 [Patescibacteria group bacterium]
MILDFAFGLTFLGALSFLAGRITPKLRELGAVPEETIVMRLHENPSKARLFLLHFKTLYQKRYHHLLFLNFLGKAAHRLHIRLLRLDNGIVRLVKRIRARYETLGGKNGTSWRDMIEIPAAAHEPAANSDIPVIAIEEDKNPPAREGEHMFLRKYRAPDNAS